MFVRDLGGLVIVVSLTAVVAYYTELQLYAALSLGIQGVSALYAIPKQDERFYDLTGSVTFAAVSFLAITTADAVTWREKILVAFVWLWCFRLGLFLFWRISSCGEDKRFKDIRKNTLKFLLVWAVQGLWVFLTLLSVLLAFIHGSRDVPVSLLDIFGGSIWIIGYIMEVSADYQKSKFRLDESKRGQFIQSGLWYYSRHPNHCGEIMMWVGVFCVSVHTLLTPALKCWAAISPVFVTFLLMFVSGIPLLEKVADERWGKTKAYQEYKAQTSLLVPMPKHKMKAT
ncbi:uncharacterized protein CCR75_006553 [Bremia lactucae]|uniref:Steroid 5-alpha reductase C-terminal domain-containing protein n=1 Tax=Bremia lactucae TaxID=4779 RepID=A0A976FJ11_BRELC|nr:hypothetical protein CCR75_006553 [Bremia lactucae]